jgi:hypothetical protein
MKISNSQCEKVYSLINHHETTIPTMRCHDTCIKLAKIKKTKQTTNHDKPRTGENLKQE